MARMVLYPYGRFDRTEVNWGEWSASLDGRSLRIGEIADIWDSKSQFRFGLEASVKSSALDRLGGGRLQLILTVSCRDTAVTFSSSADFIVAAESLTSSAEVAVPGNAISQMIELNARLLLPMGSSRTEQFLSRRIVSELQETRIALASSLEGFPTSAYSFKKHNIPEAPWRLAIIAEDLEAPFAHSIRLHLNEDYLLIQELIDGNPKPYVEQELTASITRVLIGAVARLSVRDLNGRSFDSIVEEFPESLVAGAENAARLYLRKSLQEAVADYNLRPEQLEYSISSGVGLLKAK